MRRFRWLPALLLLALVGGGGCRDTRVSGLKQELGLERRQDGLGRDILLTRVARRVVVIGPGALETAFALGAGERVIGRDQMADYPPQSQGLPVVGDFKGPYTEKVAALRPDLVIVQGETWDMNRVEQWQREIGAPVAALNASTLAGVATDIEKMGIWLGQSQKASGLAAQLQRVAAQSKPAAPIAFLEIQRSPLWSAGKETLVGEVLQAGFFTNLAAVQGLKGYGPFGLESLLAAQPQAYVVTSKQPLSVVLGELRRTAVISQLGSVRRGQVILLDGDLMLRPGPRLLQGIEYLRTQAKALEQRQKLQLKLKQ